ncbi:hypothetical protein K1X84_08805, partial [bacterium]|nr:hypothetical protein [bacterium]
MKFLIIILWSALNLNAADSAYVTITFKSTDTVTVTADWYDNKKSGGPVFLLLHRSASSRGEYRSIATELVKLGFSCLAVDLRWGLKDRTTSVMNHTALRYGTDKVIEEFQKTQKRETIDYTITESRKDIEAPIQWVRSKYPDNKIWIWGSSITAMHEFEMALKFPAIQGVIAFSPGEYEPNDTTIVQRWASQITQPCLIVCGTQEVDLSKPIFDAITHRNKQFCHSAKGS